MEIAKKKWGEEMIAVMKDSPTRVWGTQELAEKMRLLNRQKKASSTFHDARNYLLDEGLITKLKNNEYMLAGEGQKLLGVEQNE